MSRNLSCVAVSALLILVTGCKKPDAKCIDRDRVLAKLDQAAALLQDGAKAAGEHSASAVEQITSAAKVTDSIADDLGPSPEAASELRVAAARLRTAAAEVVKPGGDERAIREIGEAAKHFRAGSVPLATDSALFCQPAVH